MGLNMEAIIIAFSTGNHSVSIPLYCTHNTSASYNRVPYTEVNDIQSRDIYLKQDIDK